MVTQRYAITLSSFRNLEPLARTIPKLAAIGFETVEMFGEPADIPDIKELGSLLRSHGLSVCGITGMWGSVSAQGSKRRLLSSDQGLAKGAKQYVRDCIRICSELGGTEFNVCLFADEKLAPDSTHGILSEPEKEKMAGKAVPILSELCRSAKDRGVSLVLEPLNRYSTPFCSSAKDAVRIVTEVNADACGVLLDTFHMNIEEDSFEQAIQTAAPHLRHMHVADNNRKMPGRAHIDFAAVLRQVRKIGYGGYMSFEPNIPDKDYETEVRTGLEFIQDLMRKTSI